MKSSSTGSSDVSGASDAGGGSEARAAVRYLLIVALGAGLALALAEGLLRRYVVPIEDGRANRVALVYDAPRADAVLGDSHLYRAFINSETFANLARAGSSPHALEIVAREYYRHRAPGRVIVEASPQLFNPVMQQRKAQGHDAYFAQNLGLPFVLYVFEPGVSRELARLADPAKLQHAAEVARGRRKTDGPVVRREAAVRRALPDAERLRQARARVDSNRPVQGVVASEGFAAYRRMLELLQARGARVCLARTPVTDLYLEVSRNDPAYRETENALRTLADELSIPYVDFVDLDLDLAVDSFTNPDHLTTKAGGGYAKRLEAACFP
jgi:hypothetical protein